MTERLPSPALIPAVPDFRSCTRPRQGRTAPKSLLFSAAMTRPKLTILLASPRGFCAGVDRAIQIVEQALQRYGPPVYVRHEIVHNRTVVTHLEAKGAVFVEELESVPTGAPVIFSAHGVPKSVPAEAKRRELFFLDATCPLVSKIHREAERHFEAGRHMLLIGHAGHPEVIGTMGQLPAGAITLIETREDAERIEPPTPEHLAYITQTTLSLDDTADIIAVLRRRFSSIEGPRRDDICYATTNRQQAVKAIAPRADLVIVLGAPNSSNSLRLVEVAESSGCDKARLVQRASEIDWSELSDGKVLGLTAGASAPEHLVDDVIAEAEARFDVTFEEVSVARETVYFKLPRALLV
jgi:4-hydroxy-3-methylbut-2-en-1-yl diphosphate reductase